ncbi:MAG TPA: carbon starvation protein A [Candidatus Anammoximicrobium sp.]|nr:carbon starvation protein A [Candidatus Anammoximicrobium sp.]
MLTAVFLACAILYCVGFFTYGRFLERRFNIDNSRPTPSHTDYDGVDRVPAHPAVLFGHHFSSIAGAGPIVGPIIAAMAFGWAAPLLWVLTGAIFIGGVHDFSALVASVRNRGRSVAEIARESMSPLAYRLLLVFMWLALVYVLTAFMNLTAKTFAEDGGVATSSLLYILLAIGFGLSVYGLKIPVLWSSLIFVPLVFVITWVGQLIPIPASLLELGRGFDPIKVWSVILVGYCLVASVTPVWILLQPRDYLSSFLLYASVLAGLLGLLCGGFPVNFPSYLGWTSGDGPLFPIVFITVACGACSGFHSLVASGTSSKQIDKESDARTVGYGAMLVEGLVAVIALATVMMITREDAARLKDPLLIYGAGMGRFAAVFGIPEKIGQSFGLLALSTFILTTLDTATRLGRYIFEEFFQLSGGVSRYWATAATLALPTVFVLITLTDSQGHPVPAYKAIWPVFGATNQLLAGLTFLVLAVWLRKTGRKTGFVLFPLAFMTVATLYALVLLIERYGLSLIGVIAIVLLLLAVLVIVEFIRTMIRRSGSFTG